MKHLSLSRRTFLRGTGTLVALPLLEQMLPARAHAQAASLPRRLAVFYAPCGVNPERWAPRGTGRAWRPSPTLQPLAPLQEDILVLSGLSHLPGRAIDGDGDHSSGTGAFLSCTRVRKTAGRDILGGISMDQLAANALKLHTRIPSLALGNEGNSGVGNCESGYSCAYSNHISWAGPTTPLAKETHPQAVFDRLFAGIDSSESSEQAARRGAYQHSVLDSVLEDSRALQGRLGAVDRHKLDEYLTSVRELERRLDGIGTSPSCTQPAQGPGEAADIRARTRAMLDIIVLAFQCDTTRVATFMMGNARTEQVYDFLGLSSGHHVYSHHQGHPENLAALAKIDTWEMEQFAYLVRRMKGIQEAEGTLLDSSLVYFGSELSDGNNHWHVHMPVVLAGRGGGAVSPGRHVVYENDEPVANLFISLLAALGVQVSSFGEDGTGPLHGLSG